MDIQRPSNARAKKIKRIVYVTLAVLLCAGVTLALSRLKPAAPSVDASTIWPDTVKRGPMLREVRGLGTLVPEDIHWIPAQAALGRERGRHDIRIYADVYHHVRSWDAYSHFRSTMPVFCSPLWV